MENTTDTKQSASPLLPAPAGSAFIIKRELHPRHFMGFNEHGYTSWTSLEAGALRVLASDLEATMSRIQSTAYSNAEKLSAHLLPNKQAHA